MFFQLMADQIKDLGAIAKLAMSGTLMGLGETLFVTKKAIRRFWSVSSVA